MPGQMPPMREGSDEGEGTADGVAAPEGSVDASPAPSPPQESEVASAPAPAMPAMGGWTGDYSAQFQLTAAERDAAEAGESSGSGSGGAEVAHVEAYDFDKILQLRPDLADEDPLADDGASS